MFGPKEIPSRCRRLSIAVALLFCACAGAHAQAASQPWEGYAHCKSTKPAPGERRSCNDVRAVALLPAPFGSVIDLASIKVWEGRNVHWSQKSCQVSLSNYVEVIAGTGVMLPTMLTMNAGGRSDASDSRMDLECHVSVNYGPFNSLGKANPKERP